MPTFRDLETAAYCARKLYHRRREGAGEVPARVERVRSLAFAYGSLIEAGVPPEAPVEADPATVRERLRVARSRLDRWDVIVDPAARDVRLDGKDARGVVHKILQSPPAPSLVFTGRPPAEGVWHPQTVRLVAAALALANERERAVEHAYAEYPAHGVVRRVAVDARRRDAYRRTLRAVRAMEGVPSRVDNADKCDACEYRETCGVETRSVKSLLGW